MCACVCAPDVCVCLLPMMPSGAMQVCVYSRFWADAQRSDNTPPPLFLYVGNESPVEEYVNNTGLMWELGREMGALLVWAEHR